VPEKKTLLLNLKTYLRPDHDMPLICNACAEMLVT